MEKELLALKKEVQKWQSTPEGRPQVDYDSKSDGTKSPPGTTPVMQGKSKSVDEIPLLDSKDETKEVQSNEQEQMAADVLKKTE